MEDKSLKILRRKFLVGIPIFGMAGYFGGRFISERMNLNRWPSRLARIGGVVMTVFAGTFGIVHFNRVEIFRIGSSMMKEMENLRASGQGPFSDPQVRDKWDEQMKDRKFIFQSGLNNDELLRDFAPSVDYSRVVDDAVEGQNQQGSPTRGRSSF